jgi:hypothetical protein
MNSRYWAANLDGRMPHSGYAETGEEMKNERLKTGEEQTVADKMNVGQRPANMSHLPVVSSLDG